MTRLNYRRLLVADSEAILTCLTTYQHAHPHESVRSALDQTVSRLQMCAAAADRSIEWLQLDPAVSVGRLRRTELTQLAQCLRRFWRQDRHASQPEASQS